MKQTKNLWLLPTNKPSALGYHFDIVKTGRLDFAPNFGFDKFNVKNNFQHKPHNLFITSDEKIKVGDWSFDIRGFIEKVDETYDLEVINALGKKIILTTDQDLIKDGVQAIDDEFLEWFIKNPSCEKVDVNWIIKAYSTYKEYKIIIPKEEPKQEYEYIGECNGNNGNGCFQDSSGHDCGCFVRKPKHKLNLNCKDCNKSLEDCTCIEDTIDMKQETLEEIAERMSIGIREEDYKDGFIDGAKSDAAKAYWYNIFKQNL